MAQNNFLGGFVRHQVEPEEALCQQLRNVQGAAEGNNGVAQLTSECAARRRSRHKL